ncbi:arcE [Symbiodinium microadriaticum]|nr:arcE [Symbiodinium microadriaticum]
MADEEAVNVVSDSLLTAEIASRRAEVDKLLAKKDKAGALLAALQNPPVLTKSTDIKESNATIVDKVLAATSEAEFGAIVADLDLESCDILMKYIYRFLERSQNCANLLKFHSHLVAKAGLGSIVRVMTDRKTV